jgi:hypothetical protein
MARLFQQPNDVVTSARLVPDSSAVAPTIENLLAQAAPHQVQLVHCTSVRDSLRRIERVGQQQISQGRAVACIWSELPSVAEMLDEILDRLAHAAIALWPHWYGRSDLEQDESCCTTGDGAGQILVPWYNAAAARCRESQLPRFVGFARAVQAQQLTLAISPSRLIITLDVEDESASTERLLGLAKGAEWLALNTSSPVLVLIPDSLGKSFALDPISFAAARLCTTESPNALPAEEKQHLLIGPIHGRPHPNSLGEQLLAAAIGARPRSPRPVSVQRIRRFGAGPPLSGRPFVAGGESGCRDRRLLLAP